MIDPPTPITPSALLVAFANMTGWTQRATGPSGAGYGRGHTTGGTEQYLWPHQGSALEWTSGSSLPTSGAFDCLVLESAYNILHGGSLATDGSGRILFGGNYYRLALVNLGSFAAAIAVAA